MSTLQEHDSPGRLPRFAPLAVVILSGVIPVTTIVLLAQRADRDHVLWALAALACYLPLHLRNVWYASQGLIPPHGVLVIAVMCVIIIGALPLVGEPWLEHSWVLAVAALILLPAPWSYAAMATMSVAQAPLTLALGGSTGHASWYVFSLLWRVAVLFIVVWMIGALRQLHETRLVLAEKAIAAERTRIDHEVMRTLGSALDTTLEQGERAMARLPDDPAGAGDELQALVDDSRRTLATARQMIRGYRRGSLRTELDTALSLLAVAGIKVRLELPRELPDTVDAQALAALRSVTAALLADQRAGECVIALTHQNGRLMVERRTDEVQAG